jgi:hypothetical protein
VTARHGAVSLRADVVFIGLADIMILIGVLSLRRSRLAGLLWFKRAILVTILLAQPFLFYSQQFAALIWLVVDVLFLATLDFFIDRERGMHAAAAIHPGATAGGSATTPRPLAGTAD